MASTVLLPPGQRRLRHVDHFLARNIPKSILAPPKNGTEENSDSSSQSLSELSYSLFFTLTSLSTGEEFYRSDEVKDQLQHPNWELLSPEVKKHSFTRFQFTLFARPEGGDPKSVFQGIFDLSKIQFVSKSVAQLHERDILPRHSATGVHPLVILIKCNDGVFYPFVEEFRYHSFSGTHRRHRSTGDMAASFDPSSAPAVTGESDTDVDRSKNASMTPESAAPLLSPREDTWDLVDADAVRDEERRAQQKADPTTLADAKCLVTSSMALVRMRQMAEFQREHLRQRIQQVVESRKRTAQLLAQRHATSLRCENLKASIASCKAKLSEMRLENANLKQSCEERAQSVECDRKMLVERERRTEQSRGRVEVTHLEAKVAKMQRAVANSIVLAFPIEGNSICGYRLPDNEPESEDHAIALGHVAHLISSYASTFGFVLPHPIYVCSSRSYVCDHAGVSPERRCPLFPSRSERPLMRKALTLLQHDIAVAAFGIHRVKLTPGQGLIGSLQQLVRNSGAQ